MYIKVILVRDRIPAEKREFHVDFTMKSAELTMELFIIQMLIQIIQSGGHSKQNIQFSKQL